MAEEKNDSFMENMTNAVVDTAKAATNYVQNAAENVAEATGNLFNRNANEDQTQGNQANNENE